MLSIGTCKKVDSQESSFTESKNENISNILAVYFKFQL